MSCSQLTWPWRNWPDNYPLQPALALGSVLTAQALGSTLHQLCLLPSPSSGALLIRQVFSVCVGGGAVRRLVPLSRHGQLTKNSSDHASHTLSSVHKGRPAWPLWGTWETLGSSGHGILEDPLLGAKCFINPLHLSVIVLPWELFGSHYGRWRVEKESHLDNGRILAHAFTYHAVLQQCVAGNPGRLHRCQLLVARAGPGLLTVFIPAQCATQET